MKLIFSILFTFVSLLSIGQIDDQWRMVGSVDGSGWTVVDDSTYTGNINFQSDLTGKGFLATQIDTISRVFTQASQMYRIDSVWSTTFSSASVRIIEQGADYGTPVGQVLAFDPQGRETVPVVPFGSTGATSAMQAAVVSWNARQEQETLTAVDDGNVYYISRNGGNDATGQKGRRDLPFYDPRNLPDAGAGEDNLIYFLPGYYDMDTVGSGAYIEFDEALSDSAQSLIGADTMNYNYYFAPGAKVEMKVSKSSPPRPFMFFNDPSTASSQVNDNQINIFGEGDFYLSGGTVTGLARFANDNNKVYFKGNRIINVVDSTKVRSNLYSQIFAGENKEMIVDFNIIEQQATDGFLLINFATDQSIFEFKSDQYRFVITKANADFGPERPRLWYPYGDVGEDTIRNAITLFKTNAIKHEYRLDPNDTTKVERLNFAIQIGRADDRSNFKDCQINYDIDSYVDIEDNPRIDTIAYSATPKFDSLYYTFIGWTETVFAVTNSISSSFFKFKADKIYVKSSPIGFADYQSFYDTSFCNIDIGYLRGLYHGFTDFSTLRQGAKRQLNFSHCIGEKDAAFVISPIVDSLSTYELSGTFQTLAPGQEAIAVNGDRIENNSGKVVLKNVVVRNDGSVPAIKASAPCTLYVAGTFDYGNSPLDTNITFIRLDEFGDKKSIPGDLPQENLEVNANDNQLTVQNLGRTIMKVDTNNAGAGYLRLGDASAISTTIGHDVEGSRPESSISFRAGEYTLKSQEGVIKDFEILSTARKTFPADVTTTSTINPRHNSEQTIDAGAAGGPITVTVDFNGTTGHWFDLYIKGADTNTVTIEPDTGNGDILYEGDAAASSKDFTGSYHSLRVRWDGSDLRIDER